MTFGSLFAGIGGLDLGLERAGMTCKWQVEIDEYAQKVLQKHWPDVVRWGDITTFPPDARHRRKRRREERKPSHVRLAKVPSEKWCVDLICAGFPCQDISYAGKGIGLSGSRSGLFFEAIRVVRLLQPRYVLLENVSALLTRGLDDVLGTLASLGYDAEWHCIQAADFGSPHIRDRVFIVADHQGFGRGEGWPWRAAGASAGEEDAAAVANADGARLEVGEGKDTAGTRPLIRSKPSRSDWWATEPDVGRVANGVPSRVDRLKCLGNAVVPQIAEYIGRQIMTSCS